MKTSRNPLLKSAGRTVALTAVFGLTLAASAEVVTNEMDNASWGYVISGLGAGEDETAFVFTNTTETMSWSAPAGIDAVELLAIAGGGAGGNATVGGWGTIAGGGGGAGGCCYDSAYAVVAGNQYSISVGAGGAGANGGNTVFGALTLYGGGKGGTYSVSTGNASKGGSGGGGAGQRYVNWTKTPGTGGSVYDSNYGNPGGCGGGEASDQKNGACQYGGAGGGGGAGGAGVNSKWGADKGYAGGVGLYCSITGEDLMYASGGGGGSDGEAEAPGAAGGVGAGIGGAGGAGGDAFFYGCGGGGGSTGSNGGSGYQGIVVIRQVAVKKIDKPFANTVLQYDDGNVVTAITNGTGYVVENGSASEVGVYTATVTPLNGYVWDDFGDHAAYQVEWEIRGPVTIPEAPQNLVYNGAAQVGVAENPAYDLDGVGVATNAGAYSVMAMLKDGFAWTDKTTEPKVIEWTIAKAVNTWTDDADPEISKSTWYDNDAAGEVTLPLVDGATAVLSNRATSATSEFTGTMPVAEGEYALIFTPKTDDNYQGSGASKSVFFEVKSSKTPMRRAEWGYRVIHIPDGQTMGDNEETILVFTNTAAVMRWKAPRDVTQIKLLVVGGGGGGGNSKTAGGGGGGGGGYSFIASESVVSRQSYAISVGAGGEPDENGTSSAFGNRQVAGGGKGGSQSVGGNGGCGGGGSGNTSTSSNDNPRNGGTASAGRNGGKGYGWKGQSGSGGGGGGATAVGSNAADEIGGTGGLGATCSITGANCIYSSGGGGGADAKGDGSKIRVSAGLGATGAGDGGGQRVADGTSGIANGDDATQYGCGGGGAAGDWDVTNYGGKGFQGVVIIRYNTAYNDKPDGFSVFLR